MSVSVGNTINHALPRLHDIEAISHDTDTICSKSISKKHCCFLCICQSLEELPTSFQNEVNDLKAQRNPLQSLLLKMHHATAQKGTSKDVLHTEGSVDEKFQGNSSQLKSSR
jgi:hypothetical protein